MRAKIVAGNWKMNKTLDEGKQLVKDLLGLLYDQHTQNPVILAPPFTHLGMVKDMVSNTKGLYVAGQNCHQENNGAYTGEVSADMLVSVGAKYVILGHSERRQYFGETDELITQKVKAAINAGLTVIWCCGEPLKMREQEWQNNYVKVQMDASILSLPETLLNQVIIAYEPIWAIGTGKTATPQQAQDMHAHIRSLLADKFGDGVANEISILYGGSCKPGNAKELFSQPDVDGGLIGGASLVAEDFHAIIHSF